MIYFEKPEKDGGSFRVWVDTVPEIVGTGLRLEAAFNRLQIFLKDHSKKVDDAFKSLMGSRCLTDCECRQDAALKRWPHIYEGDAQKESNLQVIVRCADGTRAVGRADISVDIALKQALELKAQEDKEFDSKQSVQDVEEYVGQQGFDVSQPSLNSEHVFDADGLTEPQEVPSGNPHMPATHCWKVYAKCNNGHVGMGVSSKSSETAKVLAENYRKGYNDRHPQKSVAPTNLDATDVGNFDDLMDNASLSIMPPGIPMYADGMSASARIPFKDPRLGYFWRVYVRCNNGHVAISNSSSSGEDARFMAINFRNIYNAKNPEKQAEITEFDAEGLSQPVEIDSEDCQANPIRGWRVNAQCSDGTIVAGFSNDNAMQARRYAQDMRNEHEKTVGMTPEEKLKTLLAGDLLDTDKKEVLRIMGNMLLSAPANPNKEEPKTAVDAEDYAELQRLERRAVKIMLPASESMPQAEWGVYGKDMALDAAIDSITDKLLAIMCAIGANYVKEAEKQIRSEHPELIFDGNTCFPHNWMSINGKPETLWSERIRLLAFPEAQRFIEADNARRLKEYEDFKKSIGM